MGKKEDIQELDSIPEMYRIRITGDGRLWSLTFISIFRNDFKGEQQLVFLMSRHWFNADPDLAFYLNAEPDSVSQINVGTGTDPDTKS